MACLKCRFEGFPDPPPKRILATGRGRACHKESCPECGAVHLVTVMWERGTVVRRELTLTPAGTPGGGETK